MKNTVPVYMLEPDADDRYITSDTLKDLGFEIPIAYFNSSEELYSSLKQTKPRLILIDYNSKPDNARDVLRTLKQDLMFRSIPVVVLGEHTVSSLISDCYALGASAYITKPSSSMEIRNKIETFFRYWTEVAETGS